MAIKIYLQPSPNVSWQGWGEEEIAKLPQLKTTGLKSLMEKVWTVTVVSQSNSPGKKKVIKQSLLTFGRQCQSP